jgi:hypothetical protein
VSATSVTWNRLSLLMSSSRRASFWPQLQLVSAATSVRVRNGRRVVTDGPFAETREQLGGYYLVEARNLDEVIDIAGRIPGARKGTVEIRPVLEIPGLPAD